VRIRHPIGALEPQANLPIRRGFAMPMGRRRRCSEPARLFQRSCLGPVAEVRQICRHGCIADRCVALPRQIAGSDCVRAPCARRASTTTYPPNFCYKALALLCQVGRGLISGGERLAKQDRVAGLWGARLASIGLASASRLEPGLGASARRPGPHPPASLGPKGPSALFLGAERRRRVRARTTG
jgi:hypothetical protein